MATYSQIYYHLVWSTKHRDRLLNSAGRNELFRYVSGVVRNKNCRLYRINGVEDHIHLLVSLHPSVCLADLVKDIKVSTSGWIKRKSLFPGFAHWQDGYGAFTHSHAELDRVIEYIKDQEAHHRTVTFIEEYRELLEKAGLEPDDRDRV